MANTDSNTYTPHPSSPECDSLYSAMSAALIHLDFSAMDNDELLLAACYCAETRAGLCHCLNFIGEALVTFAENESNESTPESLCQLGHGLSAISLLIPVLTDIQKRAHSLTSR